MNSVELTFYVLYTILFFSIGLNSLVLIRTPAITFLKAQWRRKPVIALCHEDGGGRWLIPNKVYRGMAIFKDRKKDFGYFISRDAVTQIGCNRFGIGLEEMALITPPHLSVFAHSLRDRGFKNWTETELAKALADIERDYKKPLREGTFIDFENEKGEIENLPVEEAVSRELRERGFNAWAKTEAPVKEVLREKKHKYVDSVIVPLTAIENFYRHNFNPSRVANRISLEQYISREKSNYGMPFGLSSSTAMAIILIIIGIAIAWYIVASTGALKETADVIGSGIGVGK